MEKIILIIGILLFIIVVLSLLVYSQRVTIKGYRGQINRLIQNNNNNETFSLIRHNLGVLSGIIMNGTYTCYNHTMYRNFSKQGDKIYIRKRIEGKKKVVQAEGIYYKFIDVNNESNYYIEWTDLLKIINMHSINKGNLQDEIRKLAIIEIPLIP